MEKHGEREVGESMEGGSFGYWGETISQLPNRWGEVEPKSYKLVSTVESFDLETTKWGCSRGDQGGEAEVTESSGDWKGEETLSETAKVAEY